MQTDATGSRLEINNNAFGASSGLTVVNDTTNLSFSAAAANQYGNLRALGITMNDDGTLSINLSKLTNSIASDPTSAVNFFQNTAQTVLPTALPKICRN